MYLVLEGVKLHLHRTSVRRKINVPCEMQQKLQLESHASACESFKIAIKEWLSFEKISLSVNYVLFSDVQ